MWDASTILILILDVFISAAMTIHVLMRKRNVTSAIGWIGLAWLSPLVGAILYFTFGINRIQRRAQILRRPVKSYLPKFSDNVSNSDPFANLKATVGALTNRALAVSNISLPLHDGDDAYPQMLAEINNAKTTVGLTSYIFRSDKIGQEFIDALARANQRGVAVRVLIDGFGSGRLTYNLFRKQNVPVARFLNSILPWRMQFLNLRQHKKILVIDGVTAFIGGLNIADENTGRRRKKIKVRDTHFRISGPLVKQITADFIDDWLFTTGEELPQSLWIPDAQVFGEVQSRIIVSGPDQETEQLLMVLLSAISAAQKSIKIATPYFLPAEILIVALQLSALRGIQVRIVIPEVSDHAPMDWAMHAHIGPLLQAGCQIFRAPLPFDHSKLMVVDDAWCLFGSPNWDTRSMRLNFEMAIEAYDPLLAAKLSSIIDRSSVTPLTRQELEARSFAVKCRDAATRLLLPYL
jgi:cardiolipin synthase A/B